jgi:hypothetical protein
MKATAQQGHAHQGIKPTPNETPDPSPPDSSFPITYAHNFQATPPFQLPPLRCGMAYVVNYSADGRVESVSVRKE